MKANPLSIPSSLTHLFNDSFPISRICFYSPPLDQVQRRTQSRLCHAWKDISRARRIPRSTPSNMRTISALSTFRRSVRVGNAGSISGLMLTLPTLGPPSASSSVFVHIPKHPSIRLFVRILAYLCGRISEVIGRKSAYLYFYTCRGTSSNTRAANASLDCAPHP